MYGLLDQDIVTGERENERKDPALREEWEREGIAWI